MTLFAHDLFGWVATALIFLSQGIEIWLIVVPNPKTGERVQPSRSSFWLWTIVQAIMAASYASTGETIAAGVSVAYAVTMLAIAFLSLKYGYKTWELVDTCYLIGAGMFASIVVWLWSMSHNSFLVLVLTIGIDFIGAIATYRKAWAVPTSESRLAWALTVPACLINFLAVREWDTADLVYQPYLLAVNVAITYAIWRPVFFPKLFPRVVRS